ncbi:MAG: 3-oxo-5alpha-steroid 4-dehydrogenase [Myxococcota bacterium]|jgi:3-oxo-5alpha-steroid 4-dehydrogenase
MTETDESAGVLVIGFGGAGACAAIEARDAGAAVTVLDAFGGGGATAISGGVVYAGGGTFIQQQAGVSDDTESMLAYLRMEVGGVVSDDTLARFCAESRGNLQWLSDQGVPFDPSLCPVKTSYPTDDYFLYYSGNEGFSPYRDVATPAPRGHRAKGKSLPGKNLYAPLQAAAIERGCRVHTSCRALELITENGRVTGALVRQLPPRQARLHQRIERLADKVVNYAPRLGKRLRRWGARIEARHGQTRRITADAVILTTGGFIYNREMVKRHAPDFRRGMPLGTAGCRGEGIEMGAAVGGALAHMERVSAWRFLNPPAALIEGMLLNADGERFVNESFYGAAVGEAIVERSGGVGWLLIDDSIKSDARSQVGRGKTQWFQTAPALLNLWFNARRVSTIEDAARAGKIDPARLSAQLGAYNAAIEGDEDDAFGKTARRALKAPFYLMDVGIRSKLWPLPTLTLGGLVVDEQTGQVRREDGQGIAGLYAAGRAAVGVCSRQYISGLSIADCVFSGRRAGRSAAP